LRGGVVEHYAGAMPRGLLLPRGHRRCGSGHQWLPARHVRCGRHGLRWGCQLSRLRCGRLPCVRVRVIHGEPVRGWLLLQRSVDQCAAGNVPCGPLLPRWHGRRHGEPLPCGKVLAWRDLLHFCGFVPAVQPGLVPCCGQHLRQLHAVHGWLLLLLGNGQHAAGHVPRGLLLPLGNGRGLRKRLPPGLLLPLGLDRCAHG